MSLFNSMRTRLSIIFMLVVIILITIVSVGIGQRSIKELETEVGNSLGEVAYITGEILDQYMWSRYGEVNTLSQLEALKGPHNFKEIASLLNNLQSNIPSFSWIGFTDKDGVVRAATGDILKGMDISARPVYLEALDSTFIGDVHEAVLLAELLPNPTGETMKFVDISTPIYDNNHHFIGVLAAHLSWEWVKEVEEAMINTLKNRSDIEFFIVSKEDNIVLLGPEKMVGQSLQVKSISSAKENMNGWNMEEWDDGNYYLTGYVLTNGYKNYPGLEWTILVRQPTKVAYAPAKQLQKEIIIYGLLLAVLFAMVGWFVAGQVSKPLNKITRIADNIKNGDTVDIPKYKGIKEIEILSDSLRNLVTSLTKTETDLVKMEDLAHQDNLTKLPNRTALTTYLEQATTKVTSLTLLYIDLDGFKLVNDTLGHDAGDKLLIEVSSRLKQSVRSDEMIARVGGDEFIIVLTFCNDAKIVGERIISMINKPISIDGEIVSVGCSIGRAIWTQDRNIEDVIKRADQALYNAKRNGKNQIYFSEE
ncbi:diguanylate cyclase domain-containing protein [Evansella sp. AB-rgal1]|uniref:diguanylate cyclase domain-containing protein n=1 Tax=Evansella sp. AB-rgal1 TaxID=3242696 RepID=UPI00359E32BE